MTNHPETKPDNRNNTPREARLRSHLRASGLLADRLRNHLCTLALLADLLRNHLCTLALLADLLLIVTWSALSKTSALRRPVSLVSFSMLYLLFAAAYEKAHTRSTLKQSLTDAIRTVLLPGILAVFFANCRIFFSSEGQTPITFAKQMKTCATQLFWSLCSSQSGHPEMGVAWVLISLFWCVSLYSIVKAIFKTRKIFGKTSGKPSGKTLGETSGRTYGKTSVETSGKTYGRTSGKTSILRLALAALCAAAGYFLHKKNILLPLALDKSLLGFLLYTIGAEFAAHIFTADTSTSASTNTSIDASTDASVDASTDASLGASTDASTDASAIVRKFSLLPKHIQALCPSWLNSYIWVSIAIFAHALDGMTDPWWNHGSGIIRILLRFTLMILSTDLLIYVIDSIKAMRATGIRPIALIFKSIVEVFKPLRKSASGISNSISSRSLTERPHPHGKYILTTISGLLSRRPKASLVVFYILFTYVYLIRTVETTMFTMLITNYKPYYLRLFRFSVFILFIYALSELYKSSTNKRFLAFFCTLIIGFIHWKVDGSYNIFILCVLVVAMTDKSVKKVLTISTITTLSVLIIVFGASQNGYIYNFIYTDGGHALGTVYKTDCMALWFYTLLKYLLLRGGNLAWFEYPLLLIVIQYLFHLTQAVNNYICMVAFLILCFIMQLIKKTPSHKSPSKSVQINNATLNRNQRKEKLMFLLTYSYLGAAVLSYFSVFALTDFFEAHANGKLTSISGRLLLSREAFQKYQITLFGQPVYQQGSGGVIPDGSEYFFLDNSYVQLLIVLGLSVLILILIYSTNLMHNAYIAQNFTLLIALCIIAVHSIIEHHVSQFWYNSFLILCFSAKPSQARKLSHGHHQPR